MGKRDIQTSDYFEDNNFFADIVNGFLFNGEPVIEADKLREADTEQRYGGSKAKKKTSRDNVKKYYGDTLLCLYVLEHQQKVDYHMVIRNMLTEAMEYNRQWKEKQRRHRAEKDLKDADEFLSGMHRDEKFIPVVTIVVYYGQKKWDAATSLHEILEFGEKEKALKKYVEDYHIHVFDYHDYDSFEMFQTELNQVFSFLKCSFDKKTLREMIANRQEEYYNISDEAFELISTLTNSSELLDIREYRNREQGGKDMCKALQEIREEGARDLLKLKIQKKLNKGKTVAEIADDLEEEISSIEALILEIGA